MPFLSLRYCPCGIHGCNAGTRPGAEEGPMCQNCRDITSYDTLSLRTKFGENDLPKLSIIGHRRGRPFGWAEHKVMRKKMLREARRWTRYAKHLELHWRVDDVKATPANAPELYEVIPPFDPFTRAYAWKSLTARKAAIEVFRATAPIGFHRHITDTAMQVPLVSGSPCNATPWRERLKIINERRSASTSASASAPVQQTQRYQKQQYSTRKAKMTHMYSEYDRCNSYFNVNFI
jgi:hypothetical protein